MDNFVDMQKIIAVLKKSWWVFAICVIVSAATSFIVSNQIPPVYRAKTTLMVGHFLDTRNLNREELQVAEALAQTYAEMVLRQRVLQRVLDEVPVHDDWRFLREQMSVDLISGTRLFEISVDWDDRQTALILAEETARQMILLSPAGMENPDSEEQLFLQQEMRNLQSTIETGQQRLQGLQAQLDAATSEEEIARLEGEIASLQNLMINWQNTYTQMVELVGNDTSPNQLSVMEPAHVNPDPVWPRKSLIILIGAGLGFIVAAGFVITYEFFLGKQESVSDGIVESQISLVSKNGGQRKAVVHIRNVDDTVQSTDQLLNQLQQNLSTLSQDFQKLELLSLKDAANYLNMDISEAFHVLQENEIPIIQLGCVFRVRREDLETYLVENMLEIRKDQE